MEGQVGYAQFQDAVARRALGSVRTRDRRGELRAGHIHDNRPVGVDPSPRDQNDPGAQLRKLFRGNLASRGAADSNAGLPKGGRSIQAHVDEMTSRRIAIGQTNVGLRRLALPHCKISFALSQPPDRAAFPCAFPAKAKSFPCSKPKIPCAGE